MIVSFKSKLFTQHGIPHLFASRHGGVSKGEAFGTLNISTARTDASFCHDDPENVFENYKIILKELGTTPERAVNATQTHSDIVISVGENDGGRGTTADGGYMQECDGVLLTRKNQGVDAVCVKTADCVPILLADVKSGCVCAIHAGWRGTVAGIAERAIEAMERENCRREDIIAAIGPCIGVCCYEVGDEVYKAVENAFKSRKIPCDDSVIYRKPNGKYMLDLSAVNREIMLYAGLKRGHIDELGMCTCCSSDSVGQLFFSHRQSAGHSGAELSVVCCR